MSKIFVNGLPVSPGDFVALQNDPNVHLVTVAPLRYQSYAKNEVERHPNLQNHLKDIGVIPKHVEVEAVALQPAPEEDQSDGVLPAPAGISLD